MIRIGLVGAASSHAGIFSRVLNVEHVAGERARIAAIWSSADPEQVQQVAATCDIPEIARSLHNLVDQVDAAIIVDRHGDLHAEHALPFLLDGKPVFVDKPLAIDLADCRRMIRAAAGSGAALSSFSVLRVAPDVSTLRESGTGPIQLAQLAGPCDWASPWGGAYFYATHLIELALAVLGERVGSLRAARIGDTVTVDAVWNRDTAVSLGYVANAAYTFRASLFGSDGATSHEVVVDDRSYAAALEEIVTMFETGRSPLTTRRLLLPIVMVRAMERSLDRDGEWVDIAAMLDREVEALR